MTVRGAFEARHTADAPERCSHGDGHHYEIEVSFEGEIGRDGWPRNTVALEARIHALSCELNHRDLNLALTGTYATAPAIASWLLERLLADFPRTTRVDVRTSDGLGGFATHEYRG